MLFSSFPFLFVFLPVTFAGFLLCLRVRRHTAAAWLVLCSLFFYGWWNPKYVTLLLASMAINYAFGAAILRLHKASLAQRKGGVLAAAVMLNLAVLAYYKYAGFFVANLDALTGAQWSIGAIALPLGISFFTFTQIAFLVDVWKGEVDSMDPLHYFLFVTYFPHLIAGPILHHREVIPQFRLLDEKGFAAQTLFPSLAYFTFGLFKKVILADSIAEYVHPVFDTIGGEPLTMLNAWGGALAYTLQIYFDFSGYSDMAIGLSMLFGVRIPLNFDSPYKARSIIDFWRRWHISLSNFLRDYLYIPLGGNRKGPARRHINLMATMLLGGLWHGAGWTFIIWGGLHGLYLVINHAWAKASRHGMLARIPTAVSVPAAHVLTFVAIVYAWVFFRANSLESALAIVRAMCGGNGLVLPLAWTDQFGGLSGWLASHHIVFAQLAYFGGWSQVGLIALLLLMAWMLPNTQQMLRQYPMSLGPVAVPRAPWNRILWSPTFPCMAVTASQFSICLVSLYLSNSHEFIYYNF